MQPVMSIPLCKLQLQLMTKMEASLFKWHKMAYIPHAQLQFTIIKPNTLAITSHNHDHPKNWEREENILNMLYF